MSAQLMTNEDSARRNHPSSPPHPAPPAWPRDLDSTRVVAAASADSPAPVTLPAGTAQLAPTPCGGSTRDKAASRLRRGTLARAQPRDRQRLTIGVSAQLISERLLNLGARRRTDGALTPVYLPPTVA
ncbi:hypothetical protein MICRO8M_60266 [Microbacterium sp. 8M]|nr:hypothetical protein MICRO8M_60266 [Microbacterium sp. 8M]